METIIISKDEWYPCYDLVTSEKCGEIAEVTAEQAERYRRVLKEFAEIQGELSDIYEEAQSERVAKGKYTRAEMYLRS